MGKMSAATKTAASYGSVGKSDKLGKMDPTDPLYHLTGGDTNMSVTLKRQGQGIYYMVMKAAFDPKEGREESLAQPEVEKPQTRFPLAEMVRQHERSENNNDPLRVYNIERPQEFDVPSETQPETSSQNGKKNKPYGSIYDGKYKGEGYKSAGYKPHKKKASSGEDDSGEYNIKSIVEALEERSEEYSRKFYDANRRENEPVQESPNYGGIAAKVDYLNQQKGASYMEKTGGYDQKQVDQETNDYGFNGAEIYILPIGYDTAESQGIDLEAIVTDELALAA